MTPAMLTSIARSVHTAYILYAQRSLTCNIIVYVALSSSAWWPIDQQQSFVVPNCPLSAQVLPAGHCMKVSRPIAYNRLYAVLSCVMLYSYIFLWWTGAGGPSQHPRCHHRQERKRSMIIKVFYPRDAMLARVFAIASDVSVRLSVCPSVRLSVTRRYCA